MGTYVIEQARLSGTPKTVVAGTICSYPKHTPVPFSEDSLWQGYPEETNAPYGIAKLAQLVQAQANRAQYGQDVIYLMPTNLYGPGTSSIPPSATSSRPSSRSASTRSSGRRPIEVWGTGSASREFLYVDDAAEGIVLAAERYDEPTGEPGTDEELPIRELVGSSPTPPASRARSAGTPPSPTASPGAGSTPAWASSLRVRGPGALRRWPAPHGRLVHGPPRRGRARDH